MFEGNVEVNHFNRWGMICDDEWNINDAHVVCRQLGFVLGAIMATSNSRYGMGRGLIWMDNVICNGTESSISKCLFDGWQIHDCEPNEAAGVICRVNLNQIPEDQSSNNSIDRKLSKTKEPEITTLKSLYGNDVQIRMVDNSIEINQGYVQILLNEWTNICFDGWSINEAQVVCRQMNLGLAESFFADSPNYRILSSSLSIVSGIKCNGSEDNISNCQKISDDYCEDNIIVGVKCVPELPDLEPDALEVEKSAFIEDRSIMFLQCAMEENCLSKSAYEIDKSDPAWIYETRRLLRFTASIKNIGKIDFRPFKAKLDWVWHSCHRHYHSMEVFATFDILDNHGKRVAQGHKASFCLEDNECLSGQQGQYVCANYGDQGISVNCVDIYKHDLDCQWIDITDIQPGIYQMKVTINPEMKVPEITFENNAVLCTFIYEYQFGTVRNCSLTSP